MIIPDTNLLLYAYSSKSEFHLRARKWIEAAFTGEEPVRLPWAVINAFVRIMTNPRAIRPALPLATAVEAVSEWLAVPGVEPLNPGERHWKLLAQMAIEHRCSGPLLSDAHLAALAIENGATLYSADRDFARFRGLRWVNPLADV